MAITLFENDPNLITPGSNQTLTNEERLVLTQKVIELNKQDFAFLNYLMSPKIEKKSIAKFNDIEIMVGKQRPRAATVASYDANKYKITITGSDYAKSVRQFDDLTFTKVASGAISVSNGELRKIKSVEVTGGNTVIELFSEFTDTLAASCTIEQVTHTVPAGGKARASISADISKWLQNQNFFRTSVSEIKGNSNVAQYIDWLMISEKNALHQLKVDMQLKQLLGTRSSSLADPSNNKTAIYEGLGFITGLTNNLFTATLVNGVSGVDPNGQTDNFGNTVTYEKLEAMLYKYQYADDPHAFINADFGQALRQMAYEKSSPIRVEENPVYNIYSVKMGEVTMKFIELRELNRKRVGVDIAGFVNDAADTMFISFTGREGFTPEDVAFEGNLWQESKEIYSSGVMAIRNPHKHGIIKFDKNA